MTVTIAAGNTAIRYVALEQDLTFTPGVGGRVLFGCSCQIGETKPADRTIYAAETITIPAGSTVFLTAIDASATYSDIDQEGGSGGVGASNWGDLGGTLSDQADLQAALDAKQDASANLDEYAAVNPTSAGLALLDDADASAQLTTLGVSAFAKTLLDDADAAAVRTTIGALAETGGTATNLTTAGISTSDGANVTTANAMGALAVDVTKGLNTKSVSADSTFTFSGTPAAANTWFALHVTNTDTNPHILTFPSAFSQVTQAARTTCPIAASGQLYLIFRYDGSAYKVFGDGQYLNKFDATTAPTVNDDIADGYGPGSLWGDATGNAFYWCESNAAGAAVWNAIGGGDVTTTGTQTLTNKRVTARVTSITSSATPTVNTDNCDCVTITALAAAITSMTTNLTGTPVNFDQLEYRIKDDGTARAITWGASFVAGPTALPTTTTVNKALHVYFEWDSVQSKWVCMSSGSDA